MYYFLLQLQVDFVSKGDSTQPQEIIIFKQEQKIFGRAQKKFEWKKGYEFRNLNKMATDDIIGAQFIILISMLQN